MALALALGRRGMGRVWPNPAVGCVIVRGGRVLGRGWTADGGRPHAETQALAQAGDARGATAYVTLEPCAHHGRTPPCAEALVASGVARVVVAVGDPDPRVAGRGIAILQAAGIAVTTGVREAEARADHAGFLRRVTEGRPWLTLKLAASLDGRIATATGESQWITGPAARARVHALRARHDAVLVGAGTARDDDPLLTVRGMGERPQPVRVVLSRDLRLPLDGQLARTARAVPLWLLHAAGADAAPWEALGVRCLPCPVEAGTLDLRGALEVLAAQGITRVFCEGGGQVAASLLDGDLVDELVLFQAGVALGAEGRPMLGALGIERLAEAPRLRLAGMEAIGGDVMSRWTHG
ncbi:bifunctional diaminohydroxyphosphoribosylaminopyrimidine deaminase/5-amino-6-(5-phosphoribosylamino)uracil reductase RibD [Rubellimicrobium rubrum]|uniref:Riboflavin biosynthesis protein RibD n=2 Tax=Rubellimicrobium rubrum TaxID=2585369 RepID=A0A5C4N505_9RHOB|nr:bifunctional diaminohydroxyphosphoribosylaminopyrimidine deaminase/5-amino-6-(5-phosphoribosylamino)uracil reductase RibD [Rubellimicrobium rubrum]